MSKKSFRSIKLLICKGKFAVDAIETIKANVSPVALSFIYDSHDYDVDGRVVKTITIVLPNPI